MINTDIFLVMGSYIVIILISLVIMAWLLAGFFFPFIRVKTSRGKLLLIKVQKNTGTDWVTAEEKEDQLVFKYQKEVKRISQYKEGIYRAFNLNVVDIDPATWSVLKRDYKGVTGHDPTKVDSLLVRALMRPAKLSNKDLIMILLLIIILVGVGFIAYKLNYLSQLITTFNTVGGTNL